MKKSIISTALVVIIASGAIIAGAYAYKAISTEKPSPSEVILAFYEDWVNYQGNPLADKIYLESDYLTDSFKNDLEKIINSFDKSAYDPLLCAQDRPTEIKVLNSSIRDDEAMISSEHIFSGASKMVEVSLINEDGWKINKIICQEGEAGEGDINGGVSPAIQSLVSEHIKDNISELSPEKEVLGGTFMVISIRFIDPNLCIVDYEDGHIALTAKVKFSIPEAGKVEIESFEIIEDDNSNNPEFSEIGNVVADGDEWDLVYEKPGKPVLRVSLVFNDNSRCTDQEVDDSCLPNYWQVGDRVEVKGILEDGSVEVKSFRVIGEASKSISGGGVEINSFEDCVAAGYEILYPDCVDCSAYCETDNGVRFEEGNIKEICEDLCGNGTCEEIVCMAEGCPCAETPSSCPEDCK